MESSRKRFTTNPTIDPRTNEKLIIGSRKYNQLTKKYGDIKIKSPKSGRSIALGKGEWKKLINEGYTENELINLIGVTDINKVEKIPRQLNNDELMVVLLKSDIDTLKSACIINKTAIQICEDKSFWKNKFKEDNIPLIMKKKPKNINEWIKAYENIDKANKTAIKLVNNIIKEGIFEEFYIRDMDIRSMKWLPDYEKIIQKMDNEEIDMDMSFNVKTKKGKTIYEIEYMPQEEVSQDGESESETIIIKLSRNKFILYLTKLFYYNPKTILFDGDDNTYSYKKLSKNINKHKK